MSGYADDNFRYVLSNSGKIIKGIKMTNNNILFDSNETAFKGAFDYRKKEFILGVSGSGLLLLISFIKVFSSPGFVFLFIIATLLLVDAILCFMKVKNGSLIIRNNLIEITDGFNKTKYYEVDISKLTIDISYYSNRKSRIYILKFYDENGELVCKYRDLLNGISPGKGRNIYWQEKINSLGAKIKANYDF